MDNTQNETSASEEQQYKTADTSLFTVGGVLGITWRTLFNNPVVFFGLSIITIILGTLAEFILLTTIPDIRKETFEFCQQIINIVLGQWIGGAIAYGVYQTFMGRRALLGASLFYGLKRFVHLIFIGILCGIGVVLGTMLFVVPGLILMCMCYVSAPVCVVERLGAVDSITRSAQLTKGYRMKIFGLILVFIIIIFVATRIWFKLFLGTSTGQIINFILLQVIVLIPFALANIMPSVIYFELRRVKEGVAVDSLANVFD